MQGFLVRAVGGAEETDQTRAENLRSQSRPPAVRASRSFSIGARRKDDRVSSSLRKQKNSLTARAADVSLRLPPSRWLLAGAKPPPGPSPRSPVPADRLLRGATGTGSVSLTPGPPNGPRGAGHRLRRVPPDTFSPCRDSTSDGDVADRSIQWVSPASARVSCAFAVPRGTGTDEARHVADWTRGLARSENPAPPRNLSRAAETSPALRGPP